MLLLVFQLLLEVADLIDIQLALVVQFLVLGVYYLLVLVDLVSQMRNCLVLYLQRLLVLLHLLAELLVLLLQYQNLVGQVLPLAVASLQTGLRQGYLLA